MIRSLSLAFLVSASAAPRLQAAEAEPAAALPLPVALVHALNALSGGPHPGFRANHAKGLMVSGQFVPTSAAAGFSKAQHFSRPVPVVVRFSDATGVPTLPDADPHASPHGMAIRFLLPGDRSTDIVSISANGFPVATPEDFLAFLQAAAASPPGQLKPTPIEQFLGAHPAALKFATTPRPAPRSFATLAFYGVDAFKFTNAHGVAHFARYQILPVAGEQALSEAEASAAGPNYLMDELQTRLGSGSVRFDLYVQVAESGDPTDDPTAVWPDDRRRIKLGTLTLKTPLADQVQAQKIIMFNPLSLLAGIEPSADPVLLARPSAYGVSFSQRIQ